MGELKQKALKGVFWSGVEKIGVKAMAFIISIVIARILTPSDYGLIGMIMVFIAIANIFINGGLSQALVQKQDRSEADMTTAFYFNIVVSCICYLILYFAAPTISKFYNVDALVPLLRILGLNIIVGALGTVQRANLTALLDFKTLAYVNLSGVFISGFVGIFMAYAGYGVWALVGQQISANAVSTAVFWFFGKWIPKGGFSWESMKVLWKFGSKLLFTGLSATILNEINTVAIGKFYKSGELGYYTRAVQTSDMVSSTTNELINAVTFPILSSLQNERERMVSVYSRMLGMTAFCIFPIMTGLAVVAHPLISVLLTDKWLGAVVLLQWLCFARMFTPISGLNMNILNAIGRSDLYMKLDFSKYPLILLIMAVTIPIGVKAIVIGSFVSTFICYFINAYLPGKYFNFGVKAQFLIFWRIGVATAIMALCTYLSMLIFDSQILKLIIGIAVGLISYAISSYLLKIGELQEIIRLLHKQV